MEKKVICWIWTISSLKQENSSDEEYLQYCDTCQGYKAPRSHHCRKCKLYILNLIGFIKLHKLYLICIHCFIIILTNWYFLLGGHCIMKMDHHCPWINNCVGHFNHGHFVGFLFFAVLGCAQATVILAMTLYYGLNRVRILSHTLFCWEDWRDIIKICSQVYKQYYILFLI